MNSFIFSAKVNGHIHIFSSEAEAKYFDHRVNQTYLYDEYPVPADIIILSLVEIPNWNINCCKGI